MENLDQTVKTVSFNDLRKVVQSRMTSCREELSYEKIESRDQWKPVSTRTVLSMAMDRHPTRFVPK